MIRYILIFIFMLLNLKSSGQHSNYNPGKLYSTKELKSDLQYLKSKLEKYHPNLYLYTPKEQLDGFFDSLNNCIAKPMTDLDFYNLITLLNSK